MDLILQIWGGFSYLTNKICFALAEGKKGRHQKRKLKLSDWLFFMLMNGSMGTLMFIQNKPILAIQQGLSLCFVLYGFFIATQAKRDLNQKEST